MSAPETYDDLTRRFHELRRQPGGLDDLELAELLVVGQKILQQRPVDAATWAVVPVTLATRGRARELREEAFAIGARVLDFSSCKWISFTAADELVCNGDWDATTGECPEVREVVERALRRRGMLQ